MLVFPTSHLQSGAMLVSKTGVPPLQIRSPVPEDCSHQSNQRVITHFYHDFFCYLYIYIHIHTCIHTYLHTYMHTCIHTYLHTYVRTYIHTYIQTDRQTDRHTDIHIYIYTWMYFMYCIHTHIGTQITIGFFFRLAPVAALSPGHRGWSGTQRCVVHFWLWNCGRRGRGPGDLLQLRPKTKSFKRKQNSYKTKVIYIIINPRDECWWP